MYGLNPKPSVRILRYVWRGSLNAAHLTSSAQRHMPARVLDL